MPLAKRLRRRLPLSIVLLFLGISLPAYAQSLGDVARENREKKADAASSTPPKVITNADLPKNPDGDTGPSPASDAHAAAANAAADRKATQRHAADARLAEQWSRRIHQQQAVIANLRARIAHVRETLPSPSQNDGLIYTRYQARQMERLQRLQEQLDEQRVKLEELQDAARRAGMHTPVYDP